jgi:hypothetical protein
MGPPVPGSAARTPRHLLHQTVSDSNEGTDDLVGMVRYERDVALAR